jgi:hypothetical protein
MNTPMVPVSWGELIDKITILEIKHRKIVQDPAASYIKKELGLLTAIAQGLFDNPVLLRLKAELSGVNSSLWEIEDQIRLKEAQKKFDEGFVELARSVYKTNDHRADLKRQINVELQSELFEEKSYKDHRSR